MLKTTRSTGSVKSLKETKGKVGGNNVVDDNMVGGGKVTNPTKRKKCAKITKSKILVKSKNHDLPKFRPKKAGTSFVTPKARLAFT